MSTNKGAIATDCQWQVTFKSGEVLRYHVKKFMIHLLNL